MNRAKWKKMNNAKEKENTLNTQCHDECKQMRNDRTSHRVV